MFSSLTNQIHLDSDLRAKIGDSVGKAVEEHKPQILEFISTNMGRIPVEELQSDANIEKLARFLYPLLPGLVRMVVKEDAFAQFVIENRSIVSEKIIPLLRKES